MIRKLTHRWVLPLRWWLTATFFVVLALPVIAVVGSGALARDLHNQTRWDLEHQGELIAMLALQEARHSGGFASPEMQKRLSLQLREAKRVTLSGIRVTNADGRVIASSADAYGEDLSGDPAVQEALDGAVSTAIRPRGAPGEAPIFSKSRRARVRVFVAIPIDDGDAVQGVVFISRTPREEVQAILQMWPARLLAGVLGAIGLTIALAMVAGWILTRSLRLVVDGSLRIAEGDFGGIAELDRPNRSHVREMRQVATSVTRMATRLEERLAYIGEFASNVSHEFKTPLSTLRGTLELLEDDEDMPPAQRRTFLTNAQRSLDRLQRLVDGLLALARVDQTQPVHRQVDLDALLRSLADRHGVPLEGTAGTVLGEPGQLEVAIDNLLKNAAAYGGPAVSLSAERGAASVAITVQDNGDGISEGNLPQVFDRFFTTNRQGGGIGLGLALVKVIAERHGGDVTVTSQPGQTRFQIQLQID